MKTRKILAIGTLVILVCGVGLAIAQENLVKNEKIQVKGYNNTDLAEILERRGMYQDPETGMFEIKTDGGIPEAGISGAELKEMIEAKNLKNFRDPVTGEMNYTKLANTPNPVKKTVKRLKERGYNDSEIIEILGKHGMRWNPETGGTGIGLTSEDLGLKPPKLYNPGDNETFVESPDSTQKYQLMEVTNDVYRGVCNLMKSGSCAAEEGGTTTHVVTTHMGTEGHWTEAGVYKDTGSALRLFSYDDDELFEGSHWGWHGTTSAGVYNKFDIHVTTLTPDWEWEYDILINDDWKRSEHLPAIPPGMWPYYDVNQANEIWYDSGWTPDTTRAIFKCPRLIDQYNTEIWWNENVETVWKRNFWPPYPVKEHHEISGDAYKYETWVE